MNKTTELKLPLSHWMNLCKSEIYVYANQRMNQSGIPNDIKPYVIECVLSEFRKDAIECLVMANVQSVIKNEEVDKEKKIKETVDTLNDFYGNKEDGGQ